MAAPVAVAGVGGAGCPPARPPARALALVPGVAGGAAPLHCQPLPGGTVNESWRVDTTEGRFVLRLDGPAWRRPGVDRGREFALHGLAAAAGIAPAIIAHDLPGGVLVCEYLDGRDWGPGDLADPGRLQRLGERLAGLHALPAPRLPPFDALALFDDYVARAGEPAREAAASLRPRLVVAQARLTGPAAIVHGDLVAANVRESPGLRLLDWEYAQVADPAWDAGCVLSYHPAARPHADRWLAAMGLAGAGARVEAARQLHDALGWAWWQARGEGAGTWAPPSAN